MIEVKQITALHRDTTKLWHEAEVANSHRDLLQVGLRTAQVQLSAVARRRYCPQSRRRRPADRRGEAGHRPLQPTAERRDRKDRRLSERELGVARHQPGRRAKLNTETPGQAIDRLSILALRIYHMEEQLQRTDVDAEHLARVRGKLEILHDAARRSFASLCRNCLDDIFAGRKQLKLYRQFKMYNDPTLNPYLYQSGLRKAS